MKKYLLLLLFCFVVALTHAQAPDTSKKPPLPMDGQDLDALVVDNSRIFTLVEVMPSYPGGADSLFGYLAKHIVYPSAALSANLGGQVVLQFVVEKDGTLSGVKAIRSPYGRLSAEAVRVVSTLRLTPGQQNGQAVRVMDDLVIKFDPLNPHKFY